MHTLKAMLLLVLFCGSSWSLADSWLVAVLSGNARADAWLVLESGGKTGLPVASLHEAVDTKTEAPYVGHYGNIAFSNFQATDNHAGYLVEKLLEKLLSQILELREKGLLGDDPHFSFLYGVAGLDAVDGKAAGYDPASGRRALHHYEDIVDAQFTSHGLNLGSLVGVHDGAWLLEALKGEALASQMIIYDDTYGIGYQLADGVVKRQTSAFEGKVPAGGYFQLGREGGKLLSDGGEMADTLSRQVRAFWGGQDVTYSADEVLMRYASNNRNELGGVMSRLIEGSGGFLQEPLMKTVDALIDLAQNIQSNNTQGHSLDQPTPVKIIGFYGDVLASQPMLQKRFAELTQGQLVPELISGQQLNDALAGASLRVFQSVMKARYGMD